jgi:hypothetical protein
LLRGVVIFLSRGRLFLWRQQLGAVRFCKTRVKRRTPEAKEKQHNSRQLGNNRPLN